VLYLPGVALDYSIYTDYDHRDNTITSFTNLTLTEQAFHKLGNTVQWQVYCTARRYVTAYEHSVATLESEDWPPIKLKKSK